MFFTVFFSFPSKPLEFAKGLGNLHRPFNFVYKPLLVHHFSILLPSSQRNSMMLLSHRRLVALLWIALLSAGVFAAPSGVVSPAPEAPAEIDCPDSGKIPLSTVNFTAVGEAFKNDIPNKCNKCAASICYTEDDGFSFFQGCSEEVLKKCPNVIANLDALFPHKKVTDGFAYAFSQKGSLAVYTCDEDPSKCLNGLNWAVSYFLLSLIH